MFLENNINQHAKKIVPDGTVNYDSIQQGTITATMPLPSLTNNRAPSVFSLTAADYLMTRSITPCKHLPLFLTLTIRSLGVIFGDIGTSPLYVVNTIFTYEPTESQCIGAISLIIWNLIVVVSIKYGIFILMADNDGEGGTFALCGLLTGEKSTMGRRAKQWITIISLAAGCLLIGDGALTPAVSVLSAVEGLAVEASNLTTWIVPITVIILVLLFLAQR
ncbi:unnamed protein product [Rotaria magnacalcarata]|uniref:K+ potassium transporter integral membrane domain-containing protein n=1 Tax=Rotaria magnacalcarata TaxID=392030 RepID=A0A819FRH4_9BILA|nr:unnamed protein product [Rotaria magnacalcarata]CAF2055838.1 unnamed protein product [Rotaria magnacalcarata]CAF3836669.1 unnamed protein product [Rotaria magnacalcarata]CAF3869876.1 unnamed protein product [Rotaria magnacalcarata]